MVRARIRVTVSCAKVVVLVIERWGVALGLQPACMTGTVSRGLVRL